ncbi:MAG: NADPH:quinone reductase, partial [Mesorhizobium sp.]
MARVVRFHEHGGPEVLRIENLNIPALGRDEIQIRVKALGLNRAEALLRSGTYIQAPPLPSGLG